MDVLVIKSWEERMKNKGDEKKKGMTEEREKNRVRERKGWKKRG